MQRAPECVESRVNGVHAVVSLLWPSQRKCLFHGLKGDLYDLSLICELALGQSQVQSERAGFVQCLLLCGAAGWGGLGLPAPVAAPAGLGEP